MMSVKIRINIEQEPGPAQDFRGSCLRRSRDAFEGSEWSARWRGYRATGSGGHRTADNCGRTNDPLKGRMVDAADQRGAVDHRDWYRLQERANCVGSSQCPELAVYRRNL